MTRRDETRHDRTGQTGRSTFIHSLQAGSLPLLHTPTEQLQGGFRCCPGLIVRGPSRPFGAWSKHPAPDPPTSCSSEHAKLS